MARYSYLVTTNDPDKPLFGTRLRGRKQGNLLLANNFIPPFWLMMFDESSLVHGEGPIERDEPDEPSYSLRYAWLSRPTNDGLALTRSRSAAVCSYLGDWTRDLFERWSGYIEEKASPYLHLEPYDQIDMWKSPAAFEKALRTCLSAFDHIPRMKRGGPGMNRYWRALLGQSGALDNADGRIAPRGEDTYCGYWEGTPWSDGNFEDRPD